MSNIEFLHEYTKDGLKLQGVHWNADNKDLCVICIHGMTGNIIENYFAEVLGEELSKVGYGFIYGHNRGYCHINDIERENGTFARIGAAYEVFEESFYDIDLWVSKALELGYSNIILLGHSIGASKVIYYLANSDNAAIKKVILASPFDMVDDIVLINKDYDVMVKEAKENVASNNPTKLLNELLDDWYLISSKTFLDSCVEGTSANNLPISRNDDKFEQLSKIRIPMLVFYGGEEDNENFKIQHRLEIIKEKAINSPECEINIILAADHTYRNQEHALAELIIDYVKKR